MEVCVERSDTTHRSMPTLRMDAIEAVFELFHVSASFSDEATVHDALGGVPDGAIDLDDDQTTPAGPTSEQLARISANRADAMRRRNLRLATVSQPVLITDEQRCQIDAYRSDALRL